MAKVKYYYDPEKLAYKRIETKKSSKIVSVLLFIIASALFGYFCFATYMMVPFVESPKEKQKSRELAELQINYNLLNKRVGQLQDVLLKLDERERNLYRKYFNDKFEETEEIDVRMKSLELASSDNIIEFTTNRVENLAKEIALQSQQLDEVLELLKNKEKLLTAIPAIQPVRNQDLKRMASGFGYRNDPFTKIRKFHKGMDFTAPTGTPIFATANGVVKRADNSLSGYGNHILIDHGYGYQTLYAHLSKYNVKPGQKVMRGDVIGYVGSTGRSEAPHLHYEVYKNGQAVNPINFYYSSMLPIEYKLLKEQAEQENQSLD
jgi:murein DD-endopeptidase MepM/ murein hydrolase activator NlpD